MPVEDVKHGKYIIELKPGYSLFKQIAAPQMTAPGGKDLGGADFSPCHSYLTEPFLLDTDSRDQPR
jgi:hypothetical protein